MKFYKKQYKQTMKLYTEEQVEIAMAYVHAYHESDTRLKDEEILKKLTPIELPSDEEIEQESKYKPTENIPYNPIMNIVWIEGAKWMRDKIQGETYLKCTCSNSLEYSNCSKKCERIIEEQGGNND